MNKMIHYEIYIFLPKGKRLNGKISVPQVYNLRVTLLETFVGIALFPGDIRGTYFKRSSVLYTCILKFNIQQNSIRKTLIDHEL